MRALVSQRAGGPETLTMADMPTPEPAAGELLLRVEACAINYPDVLMIDDRYQFHPERPFSPGGEVSGIVERIGADVDGWQVGDRALALVGTGGLAESVAVPARIAFRVTSDCDPVEGSALLMTYGTAAYALENRGGLRGGETLLVLGAAGGAGLAAIEIGKLLGATVVGAVSGEEKAQAVYDAGADRVLVYGRGPFDRDGRKVLANAFKEAVGPSGADVIYDPVGGDYAEPALRAIAWGGRYLVVGFTAGIPTIPLNLALLKGCDVRGVFWGKFHEEEPVANRALIERVIGWWEQGLIRPRVGGTWSLERGGDAIAQLAARAAVGKLVVSISSRV